MNSFDSTQTCVTQNEIIGYDIDLWHVMLFYRTRYGLIGVI